MKIKRVKKPKKLITDKEKLLTGLGVGSTLLGMAGGGAPNAQNKQSPIVRKQETEKGSVKEKVKKALSKIFGIPEAKAFISTNNPCAPLDNPFAPSGNPWGWWYDWQNQGGGGGGDNFGGGGGSGVDMGGPAYVGAIQTSDGKWYHTLWGTARLFDSEAEALAAAAGVSAAQPLTIRLNGDYYNFINQGEEFTDPGYEATGADGQTVRVDISGTVDKNTPALYKITYTAWDDLGNTATATRIVTVLPRAGGTTMQSPPTIVLNGSTIITVLQNEAFTDPGATATDANGNSVPVVVGGEVDTRYPGSYTLIYTATDSNGKTAVAERTVDVIAATGNITITVNGSASMTLTVGQNYYEEGADARNSSGEGVRDITISGNVDTNIPGTYVLTYTARDDSGNTATATRTVTVVARRAENEQSPTIRLIGESNIIVNIGETFTDPGAEATDVDGSPLVAYPSSNVNINTAGNYTISYEAISNVNGKSASISRNVYVFGSTDVSSLRPAFTLDGRPVIWDSNGNGWARGADGNRELVGQNGQLLPTAPFMNVSATEIDPRSLTPVPGHEGLYTDGINLYAFDQNGNPVLQGTLHDLRQLENLGPSTVVAPSGNQLSPVPGFVGVYTDGTNFYTLDENGNPVLQAAQIPVNPFSPNNPFVGQPTVAPPYVPPAPGGQQGSELTLPPNPYANLFGGQVLATVPSVISGEPIYQEILLPNGNRAWTTNGTDYFDGSNVYKYDPNVSTDLLWYNVATNKFEPSNIDRALSIAALDQSGNSTEPSEGTGKDKQGRSVANTARNLRTAASQAGETGKKTMNRVVGIFKKDDPTKPDILNLDPSRLKALAKIGVATGVSMVATPAGGMAAGYLMRDQSKWDRLVDWATNPDKIDRDGYVTFTNPDTGQKERWSKSDVQNMLAFLQAQGLKP